MLHELYYGAFHSEDATMALSMRRRSWCGNIAKPWDINSFCRATDHCRGIALVEGWLEIVEAMETFQYLSTDTYWHLLASIGIYFFLRRWTQHMSHTTIHSDPFHGRGLSSASYLHRRILMQKKEVQLCPGIEHWCTGVLSASGPNTVCNFFLRC